MPALRASSVYYPPSASAAAQVRRLICQALAKLYLAGDQLPLYSRVSSLQLFLGTKEAFRCCVVGAACSVSLAVLRPLP